MVATKEVYKAHDKADQMDRLKDQIVVVLMDISRVSVLVALSASLLALYQDKNLVDELDDLWEVKLVEMREGEKAVALKEGVAVAQSDAQQVKFSDDERDN